MLNFKSASLLNYKTDPYKLITNVYFISIITTLWRNHFTFTDVLNLLETLYATLTTTTTDHTQHAVITMIVDIKIYWFENESSI